MLKNLAIAIFSSVIFTSQSCGEPVMDETRSVCKNLIKNISLLPDKPYLLDKNTTLTAISILEKRMPPNRRSVMKISLRFKTPENKQIVVFDSDHPKLSWNGYEFEYTGGWRDSVELKILCRPE